MRHEESFDNLINYICQHWTVMLNTKRHLNIPKRKRKIMAPVIKYSNFFENLITHLPIAVKRLLPISSNKLVSIDKRVYPTRLTRIIVWTIDRKIH